MDQKVQLSQTSAFGWDTFYVIMAITALLPMYRTGFPTGILNLKYPRAKIINYLAATVIVWVLYGSRK